MKSILDPSFHYVPSTQTDLRKTFSRVRREMARAKSILGTANPSRLDVHAGDKATEPTDRLVPAAG